jgi:hypothetical protein
MYPHRSLNPQLFVPLLLIVAALAASMLIAVKPAVQPIELSRAKEAPAVVVPQGMQAASARLTGLASRQYNLYGSTAWLREPRLTRVQLADAARLNAIAGKQYNLYGSTAWLKAPRTSRVQAAEVARLKALAGRQVNLYGSTAWLQAPHLTRVQATEAARWTVLSIAFGKVPMDISPAVRELLPR